MEPAADTSQRIDQWLCFARFVKSRNLGQALIERGKVRLNRDRVVKPSQLVKVGDVLTLAMGPRVRVIEVAGIGARRGPATEAARLFIELTPAADRSTPAASADTTTAAHDVGAALSGLRDAGAGRPTKRERRQTDRLQGR